MRPVICRETFKAILKLSIAFEPDYKQNPDTLRCVRALHQDDLG